MGDGAVVLLGVQRAGGHYQRLQKILRAAVKHLEAEQVAATVPSSRVDEV